MPAGGCVKVGKHPYDGRCICTQYDSGAKSFRGRVKELCSKKGLTFKVGTVPQERKLNMADKFDISKYTGMSGIEDMDEVDGLGGPLMLPPLDGFGFSDLAAVLDNFKDTDTLKSAGIIAVAGGAGIVGVSQLYAKVVKLQGLNPWLKSGIGLAVGLVPGIALWDKYNPNSMKHKAAIGLIAGVGGYVVADLISQLLFKSEVGSIHGASASAPETSTADGPAAGLNDDEYLDAESMFSGAVVDTPDETGTFEAIETKTEGGDFADFGADVDAKADQFAGFIGA